MSVGLSHLSVNERLLCDARSVKDASIAQLFTEDPERVANFSITSKFIHLDYSKNFINSSIMDGLMEMAIESELPFAIEKLFSGNYLNVSEKKTVLHPWLRNYKDAKAEVRNYIENMYSKMEGFVNELYSQSRKGFSGTPIRRVVSLGIGGSYLGPRLVCEALKDFSSSKVDVRFVASLDPCELFDTLTDCVPEETLFIISSKSFSTLETLQNALVCKQWLTDNGCPSSFLSKHFVAATTNTKQAQQFGLEKENCFPIEDWIGGRFSLWSAIGLPIMLSIGVENFHALRKGAAQMDQHFCSTPLAENIPVVMAVLGIWYRNYLSVTNCAVMPYSYRLRSLPEYLQQLDMESNGKTVDFSGQRVPYPTNPVVWGGMGNLGQHAYYQQLHQGFDITAIDFVLPLINGQECGDNNNKLISNALGQAQALMEGRSLESVVCSLTNEGVSPNEIERLTPHKLIDGNKPSNMLLLERISPETIGALLALYEHRAFCQGVIWRCNSFDQWGVELGKQVGQDVFNALDKGQSDLLTNPSTRDLVKRCRNTLERR